MDKTNLEKAIELAKSGGTRHVFQIGFNSFNVTDAENSNGVFVCTYTDGSLVKSAWKLAEMARNS
jgi:hypothetical protein